MSAPPSVASFLIFIRNVMGIPAAYLPDASPFVQHAFDHSVDVVNQDLALAGGQTTSWSVLEIATYNLGGHILIEYAPDQSYAISALSWSAGYANATTPVPSAIQPGDKLTILGVSPLDYSGPQRLGYVVVQATPDSTHFSYALSPNPGTATLLSNAAASEQYFSRLRRQLKINSFVPGVVGSTSDLTTSVGLDNPDFMKGLTLENLQLLKTPFGQAYLSTAQKYGPSIWGLT